MIKLVLSELSSQFLAQIFFCLPVVCCLAVALMLKREVFTLAPELVSVPFTYRQKTEWYAYLLIFLLPLMALALYPDIVIAPTGLGSPFHPDPLMQLGYMLHLPEYFTQLSSELYHATRLSVNLPGYLIYSLFPPLIARLVLFSLKAWVFSFALYSIISRYRGIWAALLLVALSLSSPFIIRSLSHELRDGFDLAYYMLSVALLFKALRTKRPAKWLFACGMAFASAVNSNILCIIFLPCLPLFYLCIEVKTKEERIKRALYGLFWVSFGFTTLMATLGLICMLLGGSFWLMAGFFDISSIVVDSEQLHVKDVIRFFVSLNRRTYLTLAASTFLLAWLIIFKALKNRQQPYYWPIESLMAVFHVFIFCIFLFYCRKDILWAMTHNTIGLFVSSLLLWGLVLPKAQGSELKFYRLAFAAFIAVQLAQIVFTGPGIFNEKILFIGLGVNGLVVLLLLLITSLHPPKAFVIFVLTAFVFLSSSMQVNQMKHFAHQSKKYRDSLVNTNQISSIDLWEYTTENPVLNPIKFTHLHANGFAFAVDYFNRVMTIHDFIRQHTSLRTIRFWVNRREDDEVSLYQGALYVWGLRWSGYHFPQIKDEQGQPLLFVHAGIELVTITRNPAALELTQKGLRELGLDYKLIAHKRFGNGNNPIEVVIVEIPQSFAEEYLSKSRKLMESGAFDQVALLALEEKSAFHPETYYHIAFSLHILKRFDEALLYYNKALENGFAEFWVCYNRGGALLDLGRLEEARADLKRAHDLDPSHEGARQQLAVAEEKLAASP